MDGRICVCCGIGLYWLVCLAGAASADDRPAADASAVISREQIEADWLRQEAVRTGTVASGKKVAPEQDARGGCDGVKNGRWGFHTENEPNPWWQVDLGQPIALERLVLYNRCDDFAGRSARIMVLVSEDAKNFTVAYRHDGQVFHGFSDNRPLSVPLEGVTARYVRLQLPGKSYLHLDEVEVYSVGDKRNVALRRPATQSSTGQWSANYAGTIGNSRREATTAALRRGFLLADNLGRRGIDVAGDAQRFDELEKRLKALPSDASDATVGALYLDARWAVRRLALRNPLLDFETILFVKAAPGQFPHMSDQFYGWWSRPGGGVCVLEGLKDAEPRLRCLTADMSVGSFLRPDLSFDAKKVLFAYCRHYPHVADLKDKASKTDVPEDAFYHIYEMNIDGTDRRQLTHGRYDDFDARYLPDGRIVFLSTRKGQFLQCSKANSEATTSADLPDSYVRCGGNNYRPVPVFTMHTMAARGDNLRPISAFENFEWTPAVANDGRILYTRWDYIDRFNGHFFSLWSANPNGTNPQLVYGNYTVRPQVVCDARPIPGSPKLVFTACAHHSILGGSLVLLDRAGGTEGDAPLQRLTPEVPFPETEANVECYYGNPYPLSEEHYLVGWSDRHLPPHRRVDDATANPVNAMGLYLYDTFGNLNLLYRDPTISSSSPIPVRPRPRPPVYPETADWDGPQEGCMLVQDIYQGLTGVSRGSVRWLRVVGVPPKVQPDMNKPNLGVSREDPGKFLLGSAPVEEDGSVYFRVPSGIPLFFQAVNADGMAVQTMRSLTYVMPQQTQACVGCHESREAAPAARAAFPTAARREPSRLTPGPSGCWPLRFDELVQPVLDQHCVSCHRPAGGQDPPASPDLTAAKAYENLLVWSNEDLHHLVFEKDRSLVGDCPARKSRLTALLSGEGHQGVQLEADARQRLILWMDLYAQRQGQYSDQQEAELRQLRQRLLPLLQP